MALILDLQNDANWQQVYVEDRNAVFDAAGGYTAIPAFEVPFTFESHVVAIKITSNNSRITWNFAGVLSQRFQLGGGLPLPTATVFAQRCRINRSCILALTKYTTEYELLFEPYRWMKNIGLTIWAYNGVNLDSTEELIQEVRNNELVRIEEKIDDLNFG